MTERRKRHEKRHGVSWKTKEVSATHNNKPKSKRKRERERENKGRKGNKAKKQIGESRQVVVAPRQDGHDDNDLCRFPFFRTTTDSRSLPRPPSRNST